MFTQKIDRLKLLVAEAGRVDYDAVVTAVNERKAVNAKVEALLSQGKKNYTDEEKKLLSQYSGRGGLKEGDNDEYFTPKEVAHATWNLLGDAKNVLDPSAGTGMFSSQAPFGAKIVGCELNNISGKVADILNDNSTIVAGASFEEYSQSMPDNSVDGIITNVPFGNRDPLFKSKDPLNSHILKNEDYFILKSLDKLKYGKRAVFLTTSSTAQRKNKERKAMRRLMLQKASFIGGYRLPSAMFKDTGTEQVVDALVFEKHPEKTIKGIELDVLGDSINEIYDAKHNKLFLDGLYFDKTPKNIFGEFISKEDMVAQAKDNDEKLHHLAQKDTVHLKAGQTLDDAKNAYRKATVSSTFKNIVDYDSISYSENIEVISTGNIDDSKSTKLLKGELEIIADIKLSKLMSNDKFIDAYEEVMPSDKFSALEDRVLGVRYLCAKKDYPDNLLEILLFTPSTSYAPEFLSLNHIKIDAILDADRDIFKGVDLNRGTKKYVLDKFIELRTYDLKSGEKIKISENLTYLQEYETSNKILSGKESDYDNGMQTWDASSFSKDELNNDKIFVHNGRAIRVTDYPDYIGSNNYRDIIATIEEQEVDADKKESMKAEMQKFKTFIRVEDLSMNVPLLIALIGRMPAMRIARDTFNENRSFEQMLEKKAIEKLKSSSIFKKHSDLFDHMVKSGWAINVVDAYDPDEASRLFENNLEWGIERYIKGGEKFNNKQKLKAVSEAKALIREGFRANDKLFNELLRSEVIENKSHHELVQDALEDRAIVKLPRDTQETAKELSELRGIVKDDILEKARHYQNEDAREFGGKLKGTMAQDTGLGKTISMYLSALYAIRSKKAKRVMIITPNAVYSKFVKESEKVLGEEFAKNNFDTAPSEDFLSLVKRIQSNKNIRLIVLPHSVLENKIGLKDETISYLYGNPKENTEDYYKNPLMEVVGDIPKFKTVGAYFEDMGVDAMFIDEAHFFKNGATVKGQIKGMSETKSDRAVKLIYMAEYIRMSRNDANSGVVTVTATPETSSPHEIYNNLILASKGDSLKRFGIRSPKDFKDMFLVIQEEAVPRISDGELILKKVLKGMQSLDMLRDAGLDGVRYRSAETEQARALADGKVIKVKPEYEILNSFIEEEAEKDEATDELKAIHASLADMAKSIKAGHTDIGAIGELELNVISRYGEMFGMFNRIKKVSMSVPLSKGVTPVTVKSGTTLNDLYKALSGIKIELNKKTIKESRGIEIVADNKVKLSIKDFVEDEVYLHLKASLPSQYPDLLVGNIFNIPSNNYDDVRKIIKALTKSKLVVEQDMFNLDDYSKLKRMINNIKAERKRHPKAKQIIYATSLVTHAIIENFIKVHVDKKAKIYLYNGTDVKNDDAGLKLQEDFNASLNPDFVVFNEKGQVGVDFNKNVCATHLLEIPNTPDANHQAMGRAVRQGNDIDFVNVYKYYQDGTFDYFMDDLVSDKANWIDQVKSGANQVSISSDKVEEIYAKALKKYIKLNISDEEKVKKYQAYLKDERAREEHDINTVIMFGAISKLSGMKTQASMEPYYYLSEAKLRHNHGMSFPRYELSKTELLNLNPFSKKDFQSLVKDIKSKFVNLTLGKVSRSATVDDLKSIKIIEDIYAGEVESEMRSFYNAQKDAHGELLDRITRRFFDEKGITYGTFYGKAKEEAYSEALEYLNNKIYYISNINHHIEEAEKKLDLLITDAMVMYGADRHKALKGMFDGSSMQIGPQIALKKDIISLYKSYSGYEISYKGANFSGRAPNFYKQDDAVQARGTLLEDMDALRKEISKIEDGGEAMALLRFVIKNS